jgi:cytochrome c biogenesis protein CcmG/thiol:disulfide interchange protein DsbE
MPIKAPAATRDGVLMLSGSAVPRFVRMRITVLALALTLLVAGCGGSEPKSAVLSPAQVKKALRGAPPKLSLLHRKANQLVGGTTSDFQKQMADLRGYPVVVNKWASWCAPCRGEFPAFQKAGLRLGKQVAFLGLDAQDNDGNARKFLKSFPVTYPSYRDGDLKISAKIQAGIAFPTTIFFDKSGKLVYAHPGPYKTAADLIADIKRYAL